MRMFVGNSGRWGRLLESRLRSHEAGMVFDAEERQLLVATAKSDIGLSYVRVPLEPTGVTVRSSSPLVYLA
jgi:hypothetical protein